MSEQKQKNEEAGPMKATKVGKRYKCTKCGFEFIVTRAGGGAIRCCDQPVEPK